MPSPCSSRHFRPVLAALLIAAFLILSGCGASAGVTVAQLAALQTAISELSKALSAAIAQADDATKNNINRLDAKAKENIKQIDGLVKNIADSTAVQREEAARLSRFSRKWRAGVSR